MPATVNQQAFPARRARALSRDLLHWYRANARALPWRAVSDPYAIWVSEVMLQQTRAEVVAARWARFIERFPDLSALARAREADVLAEWAGLGYYRRARSLHRAARELCDRGLEDLPRNSAELRLLPGFGAYTAGAVASIAFGERVPAVDGNVERVLARLLALEGDPARGDDRRKVEAAARGLLDPVEDPGELNQALMELGATVCRPRVAECAACPWSARCRAHAADRPLDYPRRRPRRATVEVCAYVAVARDGERRMLFRRRPPGGHNAGLWELPSTELLPPDSPPATALAELGASLGRDWETGEALARVRHAITHHRILATAHAVTDDDAGTGDGLLWLSADEARERGITATSAKILAKLPPLF